MKTCSIFFFLVFILASCSTIKPVAPDLPASQINSTPLPPSKIDMPVTINLEDVLNDLSSKIPIEFSGEGTVGPGQYRWHITRQPFDVTLSGDSIEITDAARFNGGGYIKNPFNGQWNNICSCDADIGLGISASLNLSSRYTLPGDAHLNQFNLHGCDLQIAGYNLTSLLKPKAIEAVGNSLAGLNQKIKQYNFRQFLQPAWATLSKPVKIADIGYLVINPSAIRLGRPSGSGKQLNISAGVTTQPVFYLDNPGKTPGTTLPEISGGTGGNGFNLNVDLHLDYRPLNQILNNNVANQKILAGTKGYIIIKDAQIYGSGNDHLLIKVKFSGKEGLVPYRGLLYFTCMPFYDTTTGDFYVKDIDFDVSTIHKLQEGPAAWILNAAVKKYLNSQIRFNILGQVNEIKAKLNGSINKQINPNVTLAGSIDSLSIRGILPVKDYILLRIGTTGSLAVKVN